MQEVLPAFPFKEIPAVYLYVGELGAGSGARGQNVKSCPRGYCRQIAGFFGRNGRLSAIIMFCN